MGQLIAEFQTPLDFLERHIPATAYPAGVKDGDKGINRYAPKSSDYPNLIIPEHIFDNDNNVIVPGYYQVKLSEDRQMLMLIQSETLVATFPVFKVEEDREQEATPQPMDNKSQRKFDRDKKKKAKENEKLIKEGRISAEPEIYANATIEYEKVGDYYLVKYERGRIKAWGTIKN